ncbi:hypothetical protein QNM97_21710 [Gordonia sp. L191]|uniref:hypothetical protein n=1 Tax=Gordonia sp. L191 TaxID=2982699 RepID=UPI0024BF6067|nr:hypothetical protein [Gordonia sp. L191]WHU46567.1 hypothetical protein QNM97_21710 [Gordonia sp. L191]
MTSELPTIRSGGDRSLDDRDATTAAPNDAADTGSGVPVLKVMLFLVGCVVLVLAAANLSNLGEWSDRWGVIPVFLVFFLVMSIAGRWFWAGADAILGALMWGKTE